MASKKKSMGGATPATPESTAAMTKFAQESAAGATPVNSLASLFTGAENDNDQELAEKLAKLERRNIPPMIKPDEIPVGSAVQGTILKFIPSPDPKIKGCLIHLNFRGTDFCLPCTGSIRNALAPGKKDEDKDLAAILAKEVGNYFYAKRTPDKMNVKYKKNMYMFDVRTGKV